MNLDNLFISKLLETKDLAMVRENRIDEKFLYGESKSAYRFICDSVLKTGEVPTERAFKSKFPKYELEKFEGKVGTEEGLKYWLEELRNRKRQDSMADSIEKCSDLILEGNVEEALSQISKDITWIKTEVEYTENVGLSDNIEARKKRYLEGKENKGVVGIPTGFPLLDYLLKGFEKESLVTIIGRTGVGKKIADYTPIPMYKGGFKKNGDLEIGDIILDRFGNPCTVQETFKGKAQIWRITFNDDTVIDCCKDHLWIFNNSKSYMRGGEWKVDTIENIVNKYKISLNSNALNIYIPAPKPVNYEPLKKQLTIDPYILGLMLGDGSFDTRGKFTFTNTEKDLLSKVSEYFGDSHYYRITLSLKGGLDNPKIKWFRDTYGYITGDKKFIPEEYLYASIEERKQLIRGLVDTDGSVDEKGHTYFSSRNMTLAKQFRQLVLSVGYRCTLKEYKRESGIDIVCRVRSDNDDLFRSEKHKEKFSKRLIPKKSHNYDVLKIKSVEVLKDTVDMTCLTVDSPDHSYLCGDFVVTHNTWAEVLFGANAVVEGYKVLHFVTEMGVEAMRDRYEMAIYAMTVGAMDYSKFKSRTLDEKAEARYFKFLDEDLQDYDNFQLITGESPMQVAGEIEKYKPDIVFIDGVYLMNDDRKSNTDTEKVYHITADLKRIAKNYKIPIVINSQADKSTSTKTGPELENISYAQSIGRDSDIVMAVYRTEMMYTDKEMGLKVLKNREGTTGKLLISWDFSDMQFKQIYFEKDSGEVVEDGNEEAIQEVNESEGLVEIE